MATIQVFSVLGKNGVMFAHFLRKTMIQLASGQHELQFNCFMSSRSEPPDGWKSLEYILKQKHTSLNHTTGLNRALDYIDGDYVIFSDTDVATLVPNWDSFLIETMTSNRLDILGVDKWEDQRTYCKFPLITFFIAKSSSYLRAQPDLRPYLVEYPNKYGQGAKEICIQTNQDAYIYGKNKGESILLDSGWQIPFKFKSLNMRGATFPKAPEYSIKYVPQIWKLGDQLGICHKGKGSKRRQSHAMKFFNGVKEYLKNEYKVRIK